MELMRRAPNERTVLTPANDRSCHETKFCALGYALCTLLLFLPPSIPAETFVIRPDGSGAFPDIQAALQAALDGDVIELTDGTFTGVGNRNLLFHGKAIVVRSQSGDPQSCVIDCQQLGRGFHFCSGEQSASIVSSVTITHANPPQGEYLGGAILCKYGSSPWIVNCTFRNNEVGLGSGIRCEAGSSPTVIHCSFEDISRGLISGEYAPVSTQGALWAPPPCPSAMGLSPLSVI